VSTNHDEKLIKLPNTESAEKKSPLSLSLSLSLCELYIHNQTLTNPKRKGEKK
jgi:hypothetical protein